MKTEKDYIARLVIYGLDTMTKREYRRLLKWLEARFEEAKREDYLQNHGKRYVARLMK